MRQETDRLREPAAWALVGFLALQLAVDALRVVFGVGSGVHGFRARAYGGQSALLDVLTPVLLAGAVLLVTHAGRPTPRARVITRAALGVLAVQGIAGVAVALGGLAYDGGGFADIPAGARVEQSAVNVGVLVLFALCAYFLIVVLGAPSPPTVTRGKSLPHQEWPTYGRDATAAGRPVAASGPHPAHDHTGTQAAVPYAPGTAEHTVPTGAGGPQAGGHQGTGGPAPTPAPAPASAPSPAAAPDPRTAAPAPAAGTATGPTNTPMPGAGVPPRPTAPPPAQTYGGTRP
ncbi:hypothetical protein ACFZBU_21700 [Embleya sp. NPDC008237]|uniref:hypothetical protein n=1 Tax=Embleya sp. NPDC008237 TaxID=3363978 RepID=UPI0036F07DCD